MYFGYIYFIAYYVVMIHIRLMLSLLLAITVTATCRHCYLLPAVTASCFLPATCYHIYWLSLLPAVLITSTSCHWYLLSLLPAVTATCCHYYLLLLLLAFTAICRYCYRLSLLHAVTATCCHCYLLSQLLLLLFNVVTSCYILAMHINIKWHQHIFLTVFLGCIANVSENKKNWNEATRQYASWARSWDDLMFQRQLRLCRLDFNDLVAKIDKNKNKEITPVFFDTATKN